MDKWTIGQMGKCLASILARKAKIREDGLVRVAPMQNVTFLISFSAQSKAAVQAATQLRINYGRAKEN